MKSIKPGRGPSMMGGFVGIVVALFGVFWTFAAAMMGGGIFALFGVVFVAIAVVNVVYNFRNAFGRNRFSEYDITGEGEEPDPLNIHFGAQKPGASGVTGGEYCPWCGARIDCTFEFCHKCGKKLP